MLPVAALAENGSDERSVQVGVQVPGVSVSAQGSEENEFVREQRNQNAENLREQTKQQRETLREQQKQQLEASSSNRIDEEENLNEDQNEQDEIDLDLEDDEDRAFSLSDLKQRIENRKHELEDEEASTTLKFRGAMKNANEVRLAVHALLASRDLLGGGGIGQQVSEIAKHMNDSVASTTNAEAKIQSRGFFKKFLFGGDSTSAEVIAQEAVKNQARIDALTTLLSQANVPADVRRRSPQITALMTSVCRLL
jgi:hypothetical protein